MKANATNLSLRVASIALIASLQPTSLAYASGSAEAEQQEDTTFGPIVVTANKREQSINDVGASVVALSGAELERRGISDIQDLAKNTPTLQYAPSVNNTPIFTIRGIGFVESSLSAYPTVSVSLDQIPLPLPALTALTAFDLERVEVLKGPQGTLFGQNTTGGAINYVAAKPTDHLTAGFNLTGGRFSRIEAEGYVSGPLSPNVRARLSGRTTYMDDWQESLTRPGDKQGKARTYAGRFLLDVDAGERTHFQLNVNAWQDKSDPIAAQYVGLAAPQVPAAVHPRLINPAVVGYEPIAPRNARFANWTAATPQFANNRFFQAALRGDIGLPGELTLTSITSVIDYKTRAFTDGDGTALVVGDIPQRGSIKSFSQELRITNDPANAARFIVGANYGRDKVFDEVHSIFYEQSTGRALGIGDTALSTHQTMKNYAAFANLEYDVVDQVTLKGGIRYTEADRVAFNCNRGGDNGATGRFVAGLRDQLLGQPAGTTVIPDSDCYTLDFSQAGIPVTRTEYRQDLKENNVSWRVGVDFKPVPGVLLYANVAQGYKAGSIPRIGATTTLAYRSVKQEKVIAYEAGFKADLVRNVFNLTGAAYYYDYTNKQLRAKIIPPPPSPFRTLEALDNIPKSRIWGTELEAHLYPVQGLSLNAAVAYTNGKVQKYSGVNAAGFEDNFDGVQMPFAPKWQYSASFDYEWQMGDVKPFIGATVNYRSKTATIIGGERPLTTVGFSTSGTTPFVIDSYTLVDLRAGVEFGDGQLRVSVFGKNVFDKFYSTNIFSTFETITRYPGMPAMYGVSVGWKMR